MLVFWTGLIKPSLTNFQFCLFGRSLRSLFFSISSTVKICNSCDPSKAMKQHYYMKMQIPITLFPIFIHTTASGMCCVAAPYFTSVLFCWFFEFSTFKCLVLSTAQAGARGVRDVAFFHYSSCTYSIKPSLQLLCNFAVFNASKG
jgi:hypothetical protein